MVIERDQIGGVSLLARQEPLSEAAQESGAKVQNVGFGSAPVNAAGMHSCDYIGSDGMELPIGQESLEQPGAQAYPGGSVNLSVMLPRISCV